MTSLIHIIIPLLLVLLCAKPLGEYMARIYMGKKTWLHWPLGWLETVIYKLARIDPKQEMTWQVYFATMLQFAALGFVVLFSLFAGQYYLPFNPQSLPGLAPDLAFNSAISFVTNTNWQSYGGERQLSYLSQSAGVVVQNFLSSAAGMATAVALFRGLKRRNSKTIGNAWADMVRSVIYILLPLSFLFAVFMASQGVIQNVNDPVIYTPLEAGTNEEPLKMAQGPVASQLAIKMLGSNGGGFFAVNSAHPFSNPTPLTNLASYIAILLIPVAFVYCFGVMVGDRRQGWALLAAMTIIFVPLAWGAAEGEMRANPLLDKMLVDQSLGNMEGKELRIGSVDSALWAVATTATSGGSVNSMHDSFMPLSGMIPLVLIQFGEVIYGGVGSGAIGMIVYVLVTVFLGGLMVGRTPEYLGKKLGPDEIKLASLVVIIPAIFVLGGTALAVSTEAGLAGMHNSGAQGFTEVLYAFSSTSNNNGSAFAGLNSDSQFYNILLAICMLTGRYWVFAAVLAIAGSLAAKQMLPRSPGTLPTHTPLFTIMLVGVILLLDVLTYVPALALGPIAEHMNMFAPTALLP